MESTVSVYRKLKSNGATVWYFRFMYKGKRYCAVGGSTKTQALRAEAKMRDDVISGRFALIRPPRNPGFEEFAKRFLEMRKHIRSSKREDLSVRTLVAFFRNRPLSAIKPSDVGDYINIRKKTRAHRRKNNVSNATVNRELACLKHLFNTAVKWGEIAENPIKDTKLLDEPPGRTRFLTEDEIELLLSYCSDYLRSIVVTALTTGMRLNEILSLQWSQVHLCTIRGSYIEIIKSKNNKPRTIPLNSRTAEIFNTQNQKQSKFVFLNQKGKPLKSIRKPFINAVRRAGITDFTFHDLRHTFASYFVMSGGDILSLKEILGHSSLKMVQRYSHLSDHHKRQQMEKLSDHFSNCHLFATTIKSAIQL